jgi:hypothetical protein
MQIKCKYGREIWFEKSKQQTVSWKKIDLYLKLNVQGCPIYCLCHENKSKLLLMTWSNPNIYKWFIMQNLMLKAGVHKMLMLIVSFWLVMEIKKGWQNVYPMNQWQLQNKAIKCLLFTCKAVNVEILCEDIKNVFSLSSTIL